MVGIILLIDGDGNAVGGIGDLSDGVDDESVVFGSIVGGDHIQTVADVKQGRKVVFVGSFGVLGHVIHAQLVGHGFHLCLAGVVQRRKHGDGGVGEGQVLAALEHLAHDLGGQGCPGTVFQQAYGAVLEVPLRQVVDEFLHKGEHIGVIGGGSQH